MGRSCRFLGWAVAVAVVASGCVDPAPDDGDTCTGSACVDTAPADVGDALGTCPAEAPIGVDAACVPDTRCEYGTECCCGQCHPSTVCQCSGGQWGCYATDACMIAGCPDAFEDPGPTDVPAGDSVQAPCPEDFHAADGTPCDEEERRCGSDCADACNWCNFLLCDGGLWIWVEVEPDPDCEDATTVDASDDVASDPGGDATATPAFRVSECGGFAARAKAATDYCAQGVLDWHRDGTSLVVTERRVLLNCCGDHAATMTLEDGTWVLTETDGPLGGSGRCNCLCVFDFEVTVPAFPDGVAPVRIVRWVTDSDEGPTTAWEGAITVGDDPGSVVVDPDSVGYGCTPG